MRLSDAIRLGAMIRPQGFGDLWTTQFNRGNATKATASCALGAAYDAFGCGYQARLGDVPPAIRAWLKEPAWCPVCTELHASRMGTIAHLNDDHRWTREQIADWVETIEHASGVRAAGGITDIADARSPSSTGVDGRDREKAVVAG